MRFRVILVIGEKTMKKIQKTAKKRAVRPIYMAL
jgi:hypothetical protein